MFPLTPELVDLLSDGVVLADATGQIGYANTAATRLLDRTPRTLSDVVPDPGLWARVLGAGGVGPVRLEGRIPGATLTACPQRDPSGALTGVMVLLHPSAPSQFAGPEARDLNEIALAIASSHDIETILSRTFARLRPLIGCDNVSLAVKEEHPDRTYHLRYLTPAPTPLSTIPRTVSGDADGQAIQAVWETGQAVIIDDTALAPRYTEDAALARAGIRSYGIYPLRGDRELIGTLNLSATRAHAFGERESRIINFVAHHVALAVEKILLIEDVEDRIRATTRVLSHLPVGVLVMDAAPDFPLSYASERSRRFLAEPERPVELLLNKPLRDSLPELEADELLATTAQVVATGEATKISEFACHSHGRDPTFWDIQWVPLLNRSSNVEAIVMILLETTEQVLARRRIQDLAQAATEQATALSAIISSMAEGVYVANADGRLVLINAAGAELVGMTIAEALDPSEPVLIRAGARYLDGRPIERHNAPLQRALRGETRSDWEQLMRRVDTGEEIQVRVAYSPIVDEQGEILGAVAVANDVTRTRQLERQREEFLSIAAHELKTPVTSIKLFAQGMLRTLHRRHDLSPERADRDLRIILKQIDRLTDLVDDFLDVSRIRTGRLGYHFEPLDAVALVRSVVERFASQIESDDHHRIHFTSTLDQREIEGDIARLDQVFTNLLANAIKYSPDGGVIRVLAEPGPAPGWVRVQVSDEGIGILASDAEAIFEPFTRAATGHNIAGIGLGLYISHEIVSRHGGRIRAESAGQGMGTTFVVELPPRQPDGIEDSPPGEPTS